MTPKCQSKKELVDKDFSIKIDAAELIAPGIGVDEVGLFGRRRAA
jgi:hypothetical protein